MFVGSLEFLRGFPQLCPFLSQEVDSSKGSPQWPVALHAVGSLPAVGYQRFRLVLEMKHSGRRGWLLWDIHEQAACSYTHHRILRLLVQQRRGRQEASFAQDNCWLDILCVCSATGGISPLGKSLFHKQMILMLSFLEENATEGSIEML